MMKGKAGRVYLSLDFLKRIFDITFVVFTRSFISLSLPLFNALSRNFYAFV